MQSFIGWIGGKRKLAKDIIARFPAEYDRYIEVFGGAGWVLFKQEPPASRLEVFNDVNSDLINLYRCVKHHCDELQRELDYMLASREMFQDCLEQHAIRGLTDIQRAARYLYTIKVSFGSDRKTFATGRSGVIRVRQYLSAVQERLKNVVIENVDFERLIRTYDRPGALFYLDPPYYGAEAYYGVEFGVSDHERLRRVLTGVKGRWVLSYNDHPTVRQLYAGCQIQTVVRENQLNGAKRSPYPELIIKNF